ncbi:hypothetical protein EJ110_NYTH01259 [Nymphaea thermarum]|nr:hypothetical protein EJ110_NYTH01259 [Nymphaea thermarum]
MHKPWSAASSHFHGSLFLPSPSFVTVVKNFSGTESQIKPVKSVILGVVRQDVEKQGQQQFQALSIDRLALIQAGSLALRVPSKGWAGGALGWRKPREAGFTEQRAPPALGSGRITSRCFPPSHTEPDLPCEDRNPFVFFNGLDSGIGSSKGARCWIWILEPDPVNMLDAGSGARATCVQRDGPQWRKLCRRCTAARSPRDRWRKFVGRIDGVGVRALKPGVSTGSKPKTRPQKGGQRWSRMTKLLEWFEARSVQTKDCHAHLQMARRKPDSDINWDHLQAWPALLVD